jgi:hypothetical protein
MKDSGILFLPQGMFERQDAQPRSFAANGACAGTASF